MKTGNTQIDNFLALELADCQKHDIDTFFDLENDYLKCGNLMTAGWFDEKSLQIAIGSRNLDDWLSTFVHESCHKDQFLEKAPTWDTKIKGHDALDLLEMWLDGVCELNNEQLNIVLEKSIAVELDCEKRTVDKIEYYDLPIDIPSYIQKSNIYVWFYESMRYTRKWHHAPYDNKELLKITPTHFLSDYSKLPDNFIKILKS
jgi:hypothetical protein